MANRKVRRPDCTLASKLPDPCLNAYSSKIAAEAFTSQLRITTFPPRAERSASILIPTV